jgi:carboxymethylenebutenolidase
VQAPVMFHFGERDAHIGADIVQRHREAYPDMAVHTYPAEHGFNCDRRSSYDAASARQAMSRTLDFFQTHVARS